MSRGRHAQGVARHRRSGLRRFFSPVVLIVCGFLLASGTAAFAYFTTSASGTGQAQAITLHTPGSGSATGPTTTSLNLSWGASPGLPAGGGYVVLRSTANGGPYSKVSSGTCNQSITVVSSATSCVDTGLAPATKYYYEVEAAYYDVSTLWVSAPTSFSGTTSATATKVTPTITTKATPAAVTVGGTAADQAIVTLGNSPTGTITWKLYKNAWCKDTPVFVTSGGGTVSGNGTYTSNPYTTTSAGTYTWAFSYSGDKNNYPVRACGGNGETLTVSGSGSGSGSLTLKPSTLPAATVGQSYNCGTDTDAISAGSLPPGQSNCGSDITASGGKAPYAYAISAGSLPPGLSLNPSTGAITGTPTAGGTFTFTVTATDSAGPPHNTGSQTYALIVNPPTITFSPSTLPSGTVGTSYGTHTISASNGTSPYTFAWTGTPPPGLMLSSAGVLSGTPTTAGPFSFTIKATDASTGTGPYTGSRNYSVTINPVTTEQAPSITSANSASFTTGKAGSFSVTTTGTPTPTLTNANFGTCPKSALPTGVTFTDNGNGTATIASTTASPASTTTFCLNAINGVIPNATQKFTLTIGTGKS